MKVSNLGINMYENSDQINGMDDAVYKLRDEINKMAVILDRLQKQIDGIEEYLNDDYD